MNYAIRTDYPFRTTKKVIMKTKLSPKAIRDFYNTHDVSVVVDSVIGEAKLIVIEVKKRNNYINKKML